MINRKKKTLLIGILCVILVIMGVGYAILSQSLNIGGLSNINGSWDVYIDSITPTTKGSGKSVSTSIEDKKISASFEVELVKPGDYVEYTVVVKNSGTTDAKLVSVTPTIIDSHEYVIFTNSLTSINSPIIIYENEQLTFTIKIEFANIDTIINGQSISPEYKLQLNFSQLKDDSTDTEILQTNPVQEITTLARGYMVDITNAAINKENPTRWKYLSNGELKVNGTGYVTKMYDEVELGMNMRISNLNLNQQVIGTLLKGEGYTEEEIYGVTNRKSITNRSTIDGHEYFKYLLWNEEVIKKHDLRIFGVEFTNWETFLSSKVTLGEMAETTKIKLLEYIDKFPQVTKITISEGVTSIDGFDDFGYKGPLILPSTLGLIQRYAFRNNDITFINLNNIERIEESAFRYNSIQNLEIPSSIFYIGSFAFANNKLTSLTINNNSLTSYYTFHCNPSLTKENIKLVNSTINLDSQVFTQNECIY